MAGFVPLFLRARFSFGYLVGCSFYGMITGFIWVTYFSGLEYDHARARLSAIRVSPHVSAAGPFR